MIELPPLAPHDADLIEADAAALFAEVRAEEGLDVTWSELGESAGGLSARRLYLAVARDPYRFAVTLLRP